MPKTTRFQQVNPISVANFNPIAPIYDALAALVFGQSLRRAQAHFSVNIPPEATILILGGGTGWLLEAVLTGCQPRQVVYLEPSGQMLTLAKRRVARLLLAQRLAQRVEFRCGTQAAIGPHEQFDVIMTPFVLDLFLSTTLQQAVLPQLWRAMHPQGLLLATDFDRPKTTGQRWLLWLMYRFFRLTTGIEARQLPDWVLLLTNAGFRIDHRMAFRNGQLLAIQAVRTSLSPR